MTTNHNRDRANMTTIFTPDLTGSQKQLDWAEPMRASCVEVLLEAERVLGQLKEVWPELHADMAPGVEVAAQLRLDLESQDKASFWIKHRYKPAIQNLHNNIGLAIACLRRNDPNLLEHDRRIIEYNARTIRLCSVPVCEEIDTDDEDET